jgi:ribonuclease-3
MQSLEALAVRLGHGFADPALLLQAVTHTSVLDAVPDARSYERMEFLGDRVLGLVIANSLYQAFPSADEAGIALRFNALVNRAACARAARGVGLGEVIVLSSSEIASGGRDKETILADACEAVIAAIYLDGGLDAAAGVITRIWADQFAEVEKAPRDPKNALQEHAAAQGKSVPHYEVTARSGPDHAPVFTVEARVPGFGAASATGPSKREAERAAARALLEKAGLDV